MTDNSPDSNQNFLQDSTNQNSIKEITKTLGNIQTQIELQNTKFGRLNSNNSAGSPSITNTTIKHKGLGGFWWTYFLFGIPGFLSGLVILLILIIALFGSIFGQKGGKEATENDNLTLKKIKESSNSGGILVYDLRGAITTGGKNSTNIDKTSGIYTDFVAQDFDQIKKNTNIKNVVFRLNTPGGEVFASELLGDLIGDLLRSKQQQQAIFYFDQIVASGGLWASFKNPNYVVASPYGETGSIGVRISLPNLSKLADNIGYKELIIKSGTNKDYGNPLREPLPEEVTFIQKQVNSSYDKFVGIVASGRKIDIAKVKDFANGFVYENSIAKNYGLIDELGSIDLSIKKAAGNAGLGDNYTVWEIETVPNAIRELLGGIGANTQIGQTLAITGQTLQKINKFSLKNGTIYAIEETKMN